MSLNNLNKRNLFEMKHQNRYALLVEAQSPEPQELAGLMAPPSVASFTKNEDEDKQINSSQQTQDQQQTLAVSDVVLDLQDNQLLPSETATAQVKCAAGSSLSLSSPAPSPTTSTQRKQSQCDSNQMSTSFASTVSGQPGNSFVGSTGGLQSELMSGPQSEAASKKNSASSFSSSKATKSACSTNLTHTTSQSMLKLDQSVRSDQFEVTWSGLSFSYRSNKLVSSLKRKRPVTPVLRDISGSFKSNQLIAIIGPSGCGKTTLLQFLAGNMPSSQDKLSIIGLEEPKVAFIGQDDCLLPGLTPRETLIYASRLQNSKDKKFNHEDRVEPILTELGLSECADRNVTKLSSGQAKRVTIAQELLYPKNLLILDEVTSGLDASTSYSIVKLLKRLVSNNEYPMTIVMSIHQPSAKLFAVFDQVYVMSEGCCLYEGSCQTDQVNTYLHRFDLECPKFHNIADYLIEIASHDLENNSSQLVKEQMIQIQRKRYQIRETQQQQQIQQDGERGVAVMVAPSVAYDPSASSEDNIIKVKDIDCEKSQQVPMLLAPNGDLIAGDGLYAAIERARARRERPFWEHLWVHFSRSTLRIVRSYILTYLQLITYIILGLQLSTFYGPSIGTISGCPTLPMSFMSFLFSNETDEDSMSSDIRKIQENMNFLLVATMTATFAALEITVITFPMEAKTVKREWRNGWYKVTSYFMGRTLADLPFQLTFVIIFCILVYSLTGQIGLTTWRFGVFVIIIIMTALISQTVGFIFGALFMDNLPAAVFTAPLCIFPTLLFSGFFSRASQVPVFYKPLTYLSHFRYAFDSLLVTLYGYDRCQCDEKGLTAYHENSKNQTSTIREMFRSLFGGSECGSLTNTANPDENSIEDSIARQEGSTSAMILNRIATTAVPKLISSGKIDKNIEDALVDSVFEHMNKTMENSTDFDDSGGGGSAMDHLLNKFSSKTITILNTRSNFGHPMPTHCNQFNSYLMTEFDLHNDDLIFGLVMLFIVVILSRLLCNVILNFTIATRTNN